MHPTFALALVRFFQTAPVDVRALSGALWLIIALPLAGALICGLFGKALGRDNTGAVANISVLGAFLLSVLALWTLNDSHVATPGHFSLGPVQFVLRHDYGLWLSAGAFRANFGLRVDHLSGTLLLVITGVGFLIHLYSTSYMEHDDGYWRYFAYLNLFVAAMLTLVLADNLVLMFVGWEGVGLCSYLLIGFWYTDAAKAWAGRKAFVINRVGDFGLLVGMFLLVMWMGAFSTQAPRDAFKGTSEAFHAGLYERGPLAFEGLEVAARALQPGAEGTSALQATIRSGPLEGHTFGGVLTVILMLFMLGAAGKSAQLPLYVWLPDAMAGPTPVSALIHAATMVTAGVYLFCRLSFLVVLSPAAMALIAVIGALTALFAALIAFAQDDIKKVLAYSTVSQLGFMFLGVGMGVFWAATLHLVTHAFFKACLFLGAGSVMHGNDEETDIKKLGGLRHEMPWTWVTFMIATVAITGVLPLSGFFSKDAILQGVEEASLAGFPWVSHFVHAVGLVAALGTAFYMTRLYLLTFEGKRAATARVPHAHESAWPMTVPLILLAFLSIAALVFGVPFNYPGAGMQAVMENFQWPVFRAAEELVAKHGTVLYAGESSLWRAWILAFIIAWVGAGSAWFAYTKFFPPRAGQGAPGWAMGLRHVVQRKFYVDEIYDAVIVKPVKLVSFLLFKLVDSLLIDTVAVRGSAWLTARAGSLLRYFQTGDVQTYAGVMAMAILLGVGYAAAKFAGVFP